ncbi:hypothetical protein [Methylocella sp.]|uniref:hypothetical protein n=1 Tax=Methylocella sp. TaxID=1978226 RepID=UPI0037846EC7
MTKEEIAARFGDMPCDGLDWPKVEALRAQYAEEDRARSWLSFRMITFLAACYLWAAIKLAVAVAVCLIYPPLWVVLLIYLGFRIERAFRMVGERLIKENERSMRS